MHIYPYMHMYICMNICPRSYTVIKSYSWIRGQEGNTMFCCAIDNPILNKETHNVSSCCIIFNTKNRWINKQNHILIMEDLNKRFFL